MFSRKYRYLDVSQTDINDLFDALSRHVIVSRRLRAAGVTGVPRRSGRGAELTTYREAIGSLGVLQEEKRGRERREARLRRRAKRFFEHVKAQLEPMKHVSDPEKSVIADLAFMAPSAGPRTVHELEEVVAQLYDEAPAFRELWSFMLTTQRVRLAEGLPFRMPPTILVSPPGTGKSTAVRRVGELLGIETSALDATSGGTFALSGLEKGWGSAGPGIVARAVLSGKIRNPLIVIDELEKGGSEMSSSLGKIIPGMHSTLLSMLEPSTARAWRCPFYQIDFDLSDVSYLMTANSLAGIPGPLLSRLQVIQVGHLSADHLAHAARQQAQEAGLTEDVGERLEGAVRELRARRTLSLRDVSRMIEKLKGDENEGFFLH